MSFFPQETAIPQKKIAGKALESCHLGIIVIGVRYNAYFGIFEKGAGEFDQIVVLECFFHVEITFALLFYCKVKPS